MGATLLTAAAEFYLGATLLAAAAELNLGVMMTTMMTRMWLSSMARKMASDMAPIIALLQQPAMYLRVRVRVHIEEPIPYQQ